MSEVEVMQSEYPTGCPFLTLTPTHLLAFFPFLGRVFTFYPAHVVFLASFSLIPQPRFIPSISCFVFQHAENPGSEPQTYLSLLGTRYPLP
jgi:hypothetical protein